MNCKNHPERQAEKKCASCGEGFCGDCLSEYQGKDYCAPCLKAEVTITTARLAGGGQELARMKRSLMGCSVVLIGLVLIPLFLLIYPCFKLGDIGRCRANLEKIHGALLVYAKENDGWLPPNNNDLRPLLTGDHLRDWKLFICPGAKRKSSSTERMSGSTGFGVTFPPGMSYLYQGGLALPEEEKAAKPLMWDRSSQNHRGKGINVLRTDGSVKFRTKGFSRIKLHRVNTDS
jgi:hypothetical protein